MPPHIFKSIWPDVKIPLTSLPDFCLKNTDRFADKRAFVDPSSPERYYTFGQIKTMIYQFAAGLQQAGLKHRDVVCVYSPNIIEYGVVFLGILLAGGVVSPANPGYTAEELSHQAKDSTSSWMVTIEPLFEKAKVACDAAHIPLSHTIILGKDLPGTISFSSFFGKSAANINKLVSHPVDPMEDMAVLPYSSGTTGLPKGVMLTHYNILANLMQIEVLESGLVTPDDVFVGVLPFFHIYGMVVVLLGAINRGNTVIVHSKFELDKFLQSVQDYKISIMHLVPPIILGLAKHPIVDKYNLTSVRSISSGAAPLGAEVCELLNKRLPFIAIRQGYGMSELSPVSHFSTKDSIVFGSIGYLLCNQQCMIVDPDTLQSQPVGVVGELWVKGPNVMKGYWNRPEATKEMIVQGGWLRTGDMGYVNEQGHYWIVDRLKELIKYKGFQVAPAELEAVILGHPEVADVAVLGIPDQEAGELPKAYVVLKPGSKLSPKDIIDFAATKTAPHKRLRGGVEFTTSIPKSASGKILRRVLKVEELKKLQSKL